MSENGFVDPSQGVDGIWRGWSYLNPVFLGMIPFEELEVHPAHIEYVWVCVGVGGSKKDCIRNSKKNLIKYFNSLSDQMRAIETSRRKKE